MVATQRDRLSLVQALRAIAALLVVVSHAQHEAQEIWRSAGIVFDDKVIPGDAGVDIFFILSGFIMVYVATALYRVPGAPARFMLRRIARVTPLYWVCTTLMVGIVVFAPALIDHSDADPFHVLASYFYIPFARPDDGLVRPVFALGWTLTYEMMFYTLFAASLALPRRWGLTAVIAGIVALVAAGRLLSFEAVALAYWTHPIILEFAIGVILGWLYLFGVRLSSAAFIPGVVAGVTLLALAPRLAHDMDPLRVVYFGLPGTIIVGTCVLAGSEAVSKYVPRWLSAMGDSSYSLYLFHPFALGLFRQAWVRTDLSEIAGPWLFVALAALFCVAVGHLTYLMIEQPLTDPARRLVARLGVRSGSAGYLSADRQRLAGIG